MDSSATELADIFDRAIARTSDAGDLEQKQTEDILIDIPGMNHVLDHTLNHEPTHTPNHRSHYMVYQDGTVVIVNPGDDSIVNPEPPSSTPSSSPSSPSSSPSSPSPSLPPYQYNIYLRTLLAINVCFKLLIIIHTAIYYNEGVNFSLRLALTVTEAIIIAIMVRSGIISARRSIAMILKDMDEMSNANNEAGTRMGEQQSANPSNPSNSINRSTFIHQSLTQIHYIGFIKYAQALVGEMIGIIGYSIYILASKSEQGLVSYMIMTIFIMIYSMMTAFTAEKESRVAYEALMYP